MLRWCAHLLVLGLALPAMASTPDSVRALIKTRDAGALAAARALTQQSPAQFEAWIELARAEMHFGEAKRAVEAAEEAVELAPERFEPSQTLGEALARRIGEVGMLSKMGMASDLRRAFEDARRLAPSQTAPRHALLQYYLQAPGIAGGGMDKARAELDAIAAIDVAEGHAALATIAQHESRHDLALAEYRKALALKPDSARFRLQVGLLLQHLKLWDEAFVHFETWTTEDPSAGAAWYQLGRTAALSGQRLEAGVTAFQRYLEIAPDIENPEPTHAWFRLGEVHRHAGRTTDAKQAFERAVALDADNEPAKKALAAL